MNNFTKIALDAAETEKRLKDLTKFRRRILPVLDDDLDDPVVRRTYSPIISTLLNHIAHPSIMNLGFSTYSYRDLRNKEIEDVLRKYKDPGMSVGDFYVNRANLDFEKEKELRSKPDYKKTIKAIEEAKESVLPVLFDRDKHKLRDRIYSPESAATWSSIFATPLFGLMGYRRRLAANKDYEDAIKSTNNPDLTVGEWKEMRRKEEELKQKLLEEAEKKSFHKLAGIINRMEKKLKLV